MMESLRSATRNTGFERWLDATLRPPPEADAPGMPLDSPKVLTPSRLPSLTRGSRQTVKVTWLISMTFGN